MKPDLSIVIVNWRSQEYLSACIASILANTRQTTFEIIVIDSASFDGCDRMLRERYPQVRFIQSRTNLGFAKANNRAFGISSADAVLFLNPDTELSGPAIDEMYAQLQELPRAGVIGCRLLNGDGTVQSSCIQSIPTILNQLLDSELLRARWPRSPLWGVAPLHDSRSVPSEVEAVSGACLMIRRATFIQVGGFTEEYFMYAEDMDLSHKVRQAGYANYYVPQATVVHFGGSSVGQVVSVFSAVMIREAIWRFLRRTRGTNYGRGYRLAMAVSAVVRIGVIGTARLLGSRSASRKAATEKWVAILNWSVGRDGIVDEYYPSPLRRVPSAG